MSTNNSHNGDKRLSHYVVYVHTYNTKSINRSAKTIENFLNTLTLLLLFCSCATFPLGGVLWIIIKQISICTRNYVSVTFRRKVRQLNFPVIRFHDLRHTFATIALSHNVHTKVVQEILGHASSKTTLDVYSHVIPTMQEQSVEILAKAFES